MFWENRRLVVIFLNSRPTKEAAMQALITKKWAQLSPWTLILLLVVFQGHTWCVLLAKEWHRWGTPWKQDNENWVMLNFIPYLQIFLVKFLEGWELTLLRDVLHTVCKRRVLPAGRSGVCESRRRTSGSPLFSVCLPTSSPTSSPPSHPLLHVQTLPGSPTVGVIVKPGSTKRGSGSAASSSSRVARVAKERSCPPRPSAAAGLQWPCGRRRQKRVDQLLALSHSIQHGEGVVWGYVQIFPQFIKFDGIFIKANFCQNHECKKRVAFHNLCGSNINRVSAQADKLRQIKNVNCGGIFMILWTRTPLYFLCTPHVSAIPDIVAHSSLHASVKIWSRDRSLLQL